MGLQGIRDLLGRSSCLCEMDLIRTVSDVGVTSLVGCLGMRGHFCLEGLAGLVGLAASVFGFDIIQLNIPKLRNNQGLAFGTYEIGKGKVWM